MSGPIQKAARGRPAAHALPAAVFTPPEVEPSEDEDAADTEIDEDALLDREAAALLAELGENDLEIPDVADDEPDEDDRVLDLDATDPPPVRLAEDGGEPLPMARFYADIVDGCVETIAVLARRRYEGPLRQRAESEAWILKHTEAILATGPGCLSSLAACWAAALDLPDPWKSWAPCFALGSVDGTESLRAIHDGLTALGRGAGDAGRAAASALAAAPHPERARLASVLAGSPHPVARAVGIDLLARLGALAEDDLARLIPDAEPLAAAAALTAAARLPAAPPSLLPLAAARLRDAHPAVAWGAARLLTLAGRLDAYHAARDEAALTSLVGSRTLELFVLAGRADDLGRMEAILARAPITRDVLSAIGRFGNPLAWSFLLHYLADEDLADAAAAALETLFGASLPRADRKRASAWRCAVANARLQPDLRYRRGVPWSAETVVNELLAGDLSGREVEARVDELRVRGRARAMVDLALWSPDVEASLAALAVAARKAWTGRMPGGWE